MRTEPRMLLGAALGALSLAGAGCAHAPATAQAPAEEEKPVMMMITGSRIPQKVYPKAEFPSTVAPVHVISRPQLDATGDPDVGAALKRIDPTVH